MATNLENIRIVQGKLAEMAQMVDAYEQGLVVAGETVVVDQQTKAKLKQRLNAMRVQCVTALNQVQL